MPIPVSKKAVSASVDTTEEEWDPEAQGFFSEFGSLSDGPSKRKAARNLAKFEDQNGGISLEKLAMDPVESAAEARRKIAERVRARAGLPAKKDGSTEQQGGAAGVDEAVGASRTAKGKIEAKFARKEARREEAKANQKKFKKVEAKKQRIESAKSVLKHRKGRRH